MAGRVALGANPILPPLPLPAFETSQPKPLILSIAFPDQMARRIAVPGHKVPAIRSLQFGKRKRTVRKDSVQAWKRGPQYGSAIRFRFR